MNSKNLSKLPQQKQYQREQLPDTQSVQQILNSKYELPHNSNKQKKDLNKSKVRDNSNNIKNINALHENQQVDHNIKSIQKVAKKQLPKQLQSLDKVSDNMSLYSANQFYDTNKFHQQHKSLNNDGLLLRKKLVNLTNGRYGDQQSLKKDFDQFSTEYQRMNNNLAIKKNTSLPLIQQPLHAIKESDREQNTKRNHFDAKRERIQNNQLYQSLIQNKNAQTEPNTGKNRGVQSTNNLQDLVNVQDHNLTKDDDNDDQQLQQLENEILEENQQEQLLQNQQEDQQDTLEEGDMIENDQDLQSKQYTESPSKQFNQDYVTKAQLDAFMEDNEDYFRHLKGECNCVNTSYGQKRCIFRQKHLRPEILSSNKSSYHEQYHPKKTYSQQYALDMRKYANKKNDIETMDIKSTNHTDYIQQDGGERKLAKEVKRYKQKHEFIGRSYYNNEFIDFKAANAFVPIKKSSEKTVIDDMPFKGKSAYQQEYVQLGKNAVIKPTMNSYMTTTVRSPIPFMSETTNRKFYRAYKGQDKLEQQKALDEMQVGNGSYKGQFKSSYEKNFIPKPLKTGQTDRSHPTPSNDSSKKINFGYSKIKSIKDIKFEFDQYQSLQNSKSQQF